ncbi:uncharacterized protein LOC123682679 isoform X2 [Harmonia axyridis]|nr:uncharacterized protein LOC123682679 isoform X2 [Harmonia axyridis]
MIPIVPIKTSLLLLSCVNELLISNSTKTLEVFLINYEEKFEMPVFRFDWSKGIVPFTTETPDVYIIKTNITVLRTTFDYLEKRLTFNPKAKFIFVVDTLAEELFLEYFMEAYIEEIIVIEHTSGKTFLLDKYKTVRNGKSYPTLTKNLENCIFSEGNIKCNKTVSYPIEYTSVRVGLSYNIPSVILADDKSTGGIDVEVLKTIAAKMKFSIYFDTVDEFAGMRIKENFSFNGALGSLDKKQVDLVVGGILPRSDSNEFFEFAGPTVVNR